MRRSIGFMGERGEEYMRWCLGSCYWHHLRDGIYSSAFLGIPVTTSRWVGILLYLDWLGGAGKKKFREMTSLLLYIVLA